MQITRETDYAVRCILHLAEKPGRVAMVSEIAEARGIPRSFLAKILQKLTRAGMVKSHRGLRGGYQLSADPADLTLRHLVEVMEGGVALNICAVEGQSCNLKDACAIHPVWNGLTENLARNLERYTFKRLAAEEKKWKKRKGV